MKIILTKIIEGIRLVPRYINRSMEKMRVAHYLEFSFAIWAQGFVVVYALYMFSKLKALMVTVNSLAFRENFHDAVLDFSLVDFMYSLEPIWELLSAFTLLCGIAWASSKFMRRSIGTVAPTIYERIKEIEEEMHGEGEEPDE